MKMDYEAHRELKVDVFLGDNLDVVKTLLPGSIDLVVTSPPYFQQRSYNGIGVGNESSISDYIESMMQLLSSLVPLVKPSGSIVYNMGDKYLDGSTMLIPYRFAIKAMEELGLRMVNNITWVKKNPTPHQFKRRLISSTEPFFHFALSNDYYYDRDSFLASDSAERNRPTKKLGAGYRSLIDESDLTLEQKRNAHIELDNVISEVRMGQIHSFRVKIRGIHAPAYGGQSGGRNSQMEKQGFTIIRIQGRKMKRDVLESPVCSIKGNSHPAIYPESIVREIVKLASPKYGTILDPYCGSGTTLTAALKEERHCVGIDINEEYCTSSINRVLEDPEIERDKICLSKNY